MQFIILFKAKFFDEGGVHYVDLAIGVYKGQSKPLDTFLIIVAAGVVLVIMTVMVIKTVVAIMTFLAIETIMAIVTILVVQTVIYLSGIALGIKCKKLVAR